MSVPTVTASVSVSEMGTVLTFKQLAESYLSDIMSDTEYEKAKEQAKRKLAQILEREGDADGERLKPYYLAQLVAEEVAAERFANYCNMLHTTLEKKEMPPAEAAGQI